ncbi:unnamed protein product [Protopolystoma xenopodis]|uniref:Uncharacterized protein n=1 Tax=Protopolystoma xenopodis TaxID=117903 RepID=A0A3S5AH86_9PLAT|nr:unnamed protein product [Protopolystoma xenopodis]
MGALLSCHSLVSSKSVAERRLLQTWPRTASATGPRRVASWSAGSKGLASEPRRKLRDMTLRRCRLAASEADEIFFPIRRAATTSVPPEPEARRTGSKGYVETSQAMQDTILAACARLKRKEESGARAREPLDASEKMRRLLLGQI